MSKSKDPFTNQALIACIVEAPEGATPCEATPPIRVNDHPYHYKFGEAVHWPQAAISAARDAGLTVTLVED